MKDTDMDSALEVPRWMLGGALAAAAVGVLLNAGGCVAPQGDSDPEAVTDVSTATSPLLSPLALSSLPGIYGTTSLSCQPGDHVAIVLPYRQVGVPTDLATAGFSPVVNRWNQNIATTPAAPTEPLSSGGIWKRTARIATQGLAAMASGCVLDVVEANSPGESDIRTAAVNAKGMNPAPRVVLLPLGFDETSVASTFKPAFQPNTDQVFVSLAGQDSGKWLAPAVYSSTIAVGIHDLDSSFQPVGIAGRLAGFSTTEPRPSFMPATFTARKLPDITGYGGVVNFVEDGNTIQVSGLTVATSIQAGIAALVASPANAHLWAASTGLIDITTGPGATVGLDDYNLGATTGVSAF